MEWMNFGAVSIEDSVQLKGEFQRHDFAYSFHATAVRHHLAALDKVNLLYHVPVSWTTSALSNQTKTC
jgi:hypothetical protein